MPFDRPCLRHNFACCSMSVSLLYIELQALHAVTALPLLLLCQTLSYMGYIAVPHMSRSIIQRAGLQECSAAGALSSGTLFEYVQICCRQQQQCSLCSAEPTRSSIATLMDPATPLPCEGPCNAPTRHQKSLHYFHTCQWGVYSWSFAFQSNSLSLQ